MNTVDVKSLRERVKAKRKSRQEIERELAQLEQAKAKLEVGDIWEEAFQSLERDIDQAKRNLKNRVERIKVRNQERERFLEEMDSNYFVIETETLKMTETVERYRMKEEFAHQVRHPRNLFNSWISKSESSKYYEEKETFFDETVEVENKVISFNGPKSMFDTPPGIDVISDEKWKNLTDNITVYKDYNNKWKISGLGYDLEDRSYKTGRLIEKRTIDHLRPKVESYYRDKIIAKSRDRFVKELKHRNYDPTYYKWNLTQVDAKLENGISLQFYCRVNYEKGTAVWAIKKVDFPEPDASQYHYKEYGDGSIVEQLAEMKFRYTD